MVFEMISCVLGHIINFVWTYPSVLISTVIGSFLAILMFPLSLAAMGFTSAGILANSFGAWMMSVVYASGWGLPLLSFFQSAGALGTISGWVGALGGAIGFVLSYIYSLVFS